MSTWQEGGVEIASSFTTDARSGTNLNPLGMSLQTWTWSVSEVTFIDLCASPMGE